MKLRYTRHDRSRHQPPCVTLTSRWLRISLDVNPRFPYGGCLGVRCGPERPWPHGHPETLMAVRGFTLDIHAYHGEPNRIHVFGARREYMIGLVEWHEFRETGRPPATLPSGREIPCVRGETVRCRPHLVRGQAWDWRRSEGTTPPRWRWLVVHPNDHRERWARAHPAEAAAAEERRRLPQARRGVRGDPEAAG